MPSGRVHTVTTLALAVGSVISGQDTALTVGILSGLILSPDLDVDEGFIGLAHLRRVPFVGNVAAKCWQWFWLPYSKVVPHRSHISHSIFFGTCARVGYLIIPVLALNFLGVPMKLPTDIGQWFIGLCLVDALHIILDNTVKGK
jgi:uncharacterized metal-binding protein